MNTIHPIISTHNLSFGYDPQTPVLDNICVDIAHHEFVAIMWPSGVGKSTFIDLLAGLYAPTSGQVLFDNEVISNHHRSLDLHTRQNVGIIFQNYGLFPWLTVREHLEFGLLNSDHDSTTKYKKITHVLSKIWLSDVSDHYPHQLSWGMKQRLSVWSVLVWDSPCLLMDEPFSAIDVVTRYQMQEFLLDIHQEFDKTIIMITHQVDEALLLADRVLIFGWKPASIMSEITISIPQSSRDLHHPELMHISKQIYQWLGIRKL